MTLGYRLNRLCYAANSGEGAASKGGRWNSVGVPVIYASQFESLAVLEILVHYADLPDDFGLTEITIPDTVPTEIVRGEQLPNNWAARTYSKAAQSFGDLWVHEGRSAVLSVPSSIVRRERNFVINPAHLKFGEIRFSQAVVFAFDPRLR